MNEKLELIIAIPLVMIVVIFSVFGIAIFFEIYKFPSWVSYLSGVGIALLIMFIVGLFDKLPKKQNLGKVE